mgnify:CR=1 FL=1
MKKNNQEIVLDDPNVNMSPAEVMDFYSMNYPELTTAPYTDRKSKTTGQYMNSRQPSE